MFPLSEILEMSVQELKEKLADMDLSDEGFKPQLQERLIEGLGLVKPMRHESSQNSNNPVPHDSAYQQSGEEGGDAFYDCASGQQNDESSRNNFVRIGMYEKIARFIPKWDGTTNFKIFQNKVLDVMSTYNCKPELLKLEVIEKLEGRARKWIEGGNMVGKTLVEIMEQLEMMFDIEEPDVEMRKKLIKRTWRAGERFVDYYQEKLILAAPLMMDDEDTIGYIIEGMDDAVLQQQAKMMNFKELKHLLRSMAGISKEKQHLPRKCYNCQMTGHMAAECKKEKQIKGACFRCGKEGHLIRDCPGTLYHVRKGKPRTSVIDVKLNSRTIEALVDTGSPISLIKEDEIDEMIENNDNLMNFVGINNSPLNILGSINTEITFEDKAEEVELMIVDRDAIKTDLLLGRDFLRKFDSKLIIGETELTFDEEDNTFNNDLMNIEHDLNISLEINNNLPVCVKNRVLDLYNTCYLERKEGQRDGIKYEMEIIVKDTEPCTSKPRPLSFAERDKVRSIIDDLLSKGYIRESKSEYCSPIVVVKKKNGERRLCCDYRQLNKIAASDNYPLPLIDELLEFLNGKKYFTTLDLRSGFHHIFVAETSRKYTSFVTPFGQYEWNRMPFGLKMGPSNFQRYINKIFEKLIAAKKIVVYVDDILLASQTVEEHLEILREVFMLLKENDMELRLDKCKFLVEQMNYLGYKVNAEGLHPNNDNVQGIIDYPIPANVKQVQRFLGMCSYFRKFVEGFSVIAKPLYDLLKKEARFTFGENELRSFEKLREKLMGNPVLSIFSPKAKTELHCDASSLGFGAILMQENEGKMHPVFYYSKRTTPEESHYCSFELECLAIIYALKRFRMYLNGIPFKIVTDCNALQQTLNKKLINPRIARWARELSEYDYVTEHRAGTRMQHVDALSRTNEILVIEECPFENTLAILQDRDLDIVKIKETLMVQDHPHYELQNGLVYKKINKGDIKFLVPKQMENQVIRNYHDNFGHVGAEKVVDLIRKHYWFSDMKSKIEDHIRGCLKCIVYNVPSGKQEGFLHSIPKGDKPFDTIHIDHMGPLETRNRYKYVFAVIDGFSKFVKLYPTRTTNTEEAVKCLENYFKDYSRPIRLVSDRGSGFTSTKFNEFMEKCNIKHILTAALTPRANGQIERVNRTMTPMIAKLIDKPNKKFWVEVLSDVEFALNNTIVKSIKTTPSKLLFGLEQRGEVNDKIAEYLNEFVWDEDNINFEESRQRAQNNINKSQEASERHYNKTKKEAVKYKEGDLVVIKNIDTTIGVSKKFIPKYKGPYKIERVLPNDRYVVTDIDGYQVTNKPFNSVYEANKIKLYYKDM